MKSHNTSLETLKKLCYVLFIAQYNSKVFRQNLWSHQSRHRVPLENLLWSLSSCDYKRKEMVPFYLGVPTTKSAVGSHFDFAARKAKGKKKKTVFWTRHTGKKLGDRGCQPSPLATSQVPIFNSLFLYCWPLEGYRNTVVNRKLKNGNSSESQLALVKKLCAEVHAVCTRGWLCSQSLWWAVKLNTTIWWTPWNSTEIDTKWTQKRLIKLIHCFHRSESFYLLDKSENEKMKLTASPFWGKSNLENKITAHSEHKGTYLLWHLCASSLPRGAFLNDGLYAIYNPRSNILSKSLTLKWFFLSCTNIHLFIHSSTNIYECLWCARHYFRCYGYSSE